MTRKPALPARWPWLAVVLVAGLAACQAQPAATPTPPPPPRPTAVYARLPYLLEPAYGSHFQTVQVLLDWRGPAELGPDEHYDVRVWKEGQPPYGIAWTAATEYQLDDFIRRGGPGTYYWTIAIIRGRDGQMQAELSDTPEPWQFVVDALPTPTPASTGLTLPPGFAAQEFARADLPTSLAWGPDGYLYASTQGGAIVRFRDGDGDHRAEDSGQFAADFNTPLGLAFRGDTLYVSSVENVTTLRDRDGDGQADERRDIIEELPAREYDGHQNNGLAFGPDGRLYIAIGSTSDHGPLRHPLEAGILVANADGSDLRRFASGLRNPYALVFAPDGSLFVPDNAPDIPDQRVPFIPAEELNHVVEGGNYGFPDVYGQPPPGSGTQAPILLFPTGSVPTGIAYYGAGLFPAEYRGNLFVALWGAGMIKARNGHKVVRVRLTRSGDTWQAEPVDFLATYDNPIALAVGPDGALYMAHYLDGWIFRLAPAAR